MLVFEMARICKHLKKTKYAFARTYDMPVCTRKWVSFTIHAATPRMVWMWFLLPRVPVPAFMYAHMYVDGCTSFLPQHQNGFAATIEQR